MPPKIANATQVASEGTPAETTSDRPVSKPESPIKAGSPSNVRGNKRKLSGLGNPQLKKGKNQLMPDSDSSTSSSSDSDVPQIIEPSKDIDQLSKSASSLEVRDAAMEPAPASSTASPSAETSSATSKSHGALPPKDPFPEVLDWAAKVEIAEAKKAHNEAWKTECKDKVAQKKQAKLAQLDADRLAGKPPLRGGETHSLVLLPFFCLFLTAITALQSRPGGPIVENPPDLPVVAAAFYEVLFAEQPTNARKGREFIDLMPKIPRALGESISAPITSTEVRAAIKGAPTDTMAQVQLWEDVREL
ncbi:hypothetical protein NDA10_002963 [Ustilago hordei]|nr:hypothetical protein NDA10_002963 [Ustilago hordei]